MAHRDVHLASQTTFSRRSLSDNSDSRMSSRRPSRRPLSRPLSSSSCCSGCSECAGQAVCDSDGHGCYGVGSFNEHPVQFIDGMWCEPLEHLIGMQSLMGLPSGFLLDTRVVAHGFGDGPEVFVEIHAQEGCRIGQLDVERALRSIPIEAFAPGRLYYWEGINRSENMAYVMWGS